ncbi:MAG: ABC transporter substrate-binding protein [Myxococcales bacterium]|nr:ABC transporter substrate-binding protein [Myxococcales bacterium]
MRRLRLAMSLLAAAATSACTRSPATTERERVTVGVSLLRISQPVFVAQDKGLFTAHGLDVDLKRFDTAQPFGDELAAGRLDAAGYVALPILFSREGGPPPLRLATALVEDDEHPLSLFLVKPDSTLDSVAALKGKNIGILPTIAYRRWLEAILSKEGLTLADVTVTPLAPPLQVDSLASGGIDALFTGDPMATAAVARGVARPLRAGAEVPRALGAPFFFGSFALSEALATKRPKVAAALVAALDEAVALIAKDEQVGREAMAHYVREPERPFVSKYAKTRYLPSTAVDAASLDTALSRETVHVPGAKVLWKAP